MPVIRRWKTGLRLWRIRLKPFTEPWTYRRPHVSSSCVKSQPRQQLNMEIEDLRSVIKAAGGGSNALAYSEELLAKISRIESTNSCNRLLAQFCAAREQGDFRGRTLEINFADLFVQQSRALVYAARQGMTGDIDFQCRIADRDIFIEMKLLGQDRATRDAINLQLERCGSSSTLITDDTRDVRRIQSDLIQKASTRKFNPRPNPSWINLVAIDVTELQLGTIDICDCLIAAGGNTVASNYYESACLREEVVGVFEAPVVANLTTSQQDWLTHIKNLLNGAPHPRDYIHGALFLFREPKEIAALSYDISAIVVWNPGLVTEDIARKICPTLHDIIPPAKICSQKSH